MAIKTWNGVQITNMAVMEQLIAKHFGISGSLELLIGARVVGAPMNTLRHSFQFEYKGADIICQVLFMNAVIQGFDIRYPLS